MGIVNFEPPPRSMPGLRVLPPGPAVTFFLQEAFVDINIGGSWGAWLSTVNCLLRGDRWPGAGAMALGGAPRQSWTVMRA